MGLPAHPTHEGEGRGLRPAAHTAATQQEGLMDSNRFMEWVTEVLTRAAEAPEVAAAEIPFFVSDLRARARTHAHSHARARTHARTHMSRTHTHLLNSNSSLDDL